MPILDLSPMEVLCSTLLTLEELGAELAGLTITVRISPTGVSHAPRCRQVGKKAAAEETMTIGALRAAGETRPCRTCGGAVIEKLSGGQSEQLEALVPILETRLERMREAEREQQLYRERVRRADLIDERAGHIVNGWKWKIEEERRLADRYPADRRIAAVPCADCGASATISFDPRSLDVSYVCPNDSGHGYHRMADDKEPLDVWRHSGQNNLEALGLVAPVLAGDDDAWAMTYGTRVDDYRSTLSALEAFDRAHPPRVRLAADIRCGDCGDPLSSWPGRNAGGLRIEAHYSCDNRHEDGRYRRHEKKLVDEEIDWILHRRLHDHPSWATAAEMEPDQEKVAVHADDLAEKIAIFDVRIGAAKSVDDLVEIRARLAEELDLVSRIREHGGLATADLTKYSAGPASYALRWTFTDLARALLTERIEVNGQAIRVVTPFDDGTPLRRLLRSREIRDELTELQQRQTALERELAELDGN